MTFSRNAAIRRILSPIVLAALAGTSVVAWQAPAAAQKKEKPAPAAKANYSKGFVAAYKPIETMVNAATPDYAAAKAALPGLIAASETPDDKAATGRLLFSVGQKTNDNAMTLQGAEMILANGGAGDHRSKFNMAAAQLAYNLNDYAKARTYTQAAIDSGYTDNDPQLFLAETYFAADQYAEGLKYLSDTIAARKSAGQPVSETWIKRALATAYNNQLNDEARRWSLMYVSDYPNQTSWGDAIAIAINTGQYQPQEMLDILRLARITNTMRTRAQFLEYVDAADPRKLPQEVVAVLDAGVAAKLVDNNVQMVKEARTTAAARLAADKAELPSLQRDANAAGAKLVTVMAGADTMLSYGKYAEAEALYAKAAAMPGANVPLILTRQGIAQVEQGKFTEAQATFAKVQGARQPIANLWALYASQKASGTVIAPAPAATTTGAAQ